MQPSKESIPERKRGDPILLKTNLKDVPISVKLRNWKCQSVNELINKPLQEKKKFSVISFTGSVRKGFLDTSSLLRRQDLNKTEADLSPFNTMEVLTEPNFQSTSILNTSRSSNSNKTARSGNSNTFKILIKEDYSNYIQILKRIYPSFKFNHYNRISTEYLDYFKKYGEEGDINNRNFRPAGLDYDILQKKDYKPSNLLDILGVQENINAPSKEFKIKADFLSRNDPYEISMIKEDLSFKTGVIDKELNHILQSQATQLYNYIEKNRNLKEQIDKYTEETKNKIDIHKKIYQNYKNNSIQLLLKETKKKQIIKLLTPLKILNELRTCMIELNLISLSENENKIKEISDSTNIAKEKIKSLKKYNNNLKNNLIIEVENKIIKYESLGEENLNDKFAENVEKLIQKCLIYDKANDLISNNFNEKNENKKSNRSLSEIENKNPNLIFIEKDYELIDEKENIYIKYLLIYNNYNSKYEIYKLLISILDMFEIIIKDNLDISSIVDVFKTVFKKIISKNFEIIENKSSNKLTNIEIITNCYCNIISNYSYIIQLIQNNFGMNVKIFNEVTTMIKSDMNEFVKCLISSYLHQLIYENENENDWGLFLVGIDETKEKTKIFNSCTKLNWNLVIEGTFNNYYTNFDETKTNNLASKLDNLTWKPIEKISIKYQEMFNILYNKENIDEMNNIKAKDIIFIEPNDDNEKGNEFLILNNENNEDDKKHKITLFSLSYIKYVYEYLVIYLYAPNETFKNNILNKIFKVTKDILSQTTNFLMNTQKTEIETSLYYSDLFIVETCLKKFSIINKFNNNLYQEVIKTINDLKKTCKDNIQHLIKDCTLQFNDSFNKLNFKNYPIFDDGKTYNDYVKKLTILKRLYDNMFNKFTDEDIKDLFKTEYDIMVNNFKDSVISKGIMEDDKQLKQFRRELLYLKKVFQLFAIVDTSAYQSIMDELKVKVNPNKLPKKKKTKKKQEKEDNDEEEN